MRRPGRIFTTKVSLVPSGIGRRSCHATDFELPVGMSKIPKSEAAKLAYKSLPIPGDPENYAVALSVFHDLHCLVRKPPPSRCSDLLDATVANGRSELAPPALLGHRAPGLRPGRRGRVRPPLPLRSRADAHGPLHRRYPGEPHVQRGHQPGRVAVGRGGAEDGPAVPRAAHVPRLWGHLGLGQGEPVPGF